VSSDTKTIGLIAGNRQFPFLFVRAAKDQGYKVVVAGVWGDTSPLLAAFADDFQYFYVGQMKKMISYFKDKGVAQVIMAGQVDPNHLFDPRLALDEEFASLEGSLKDRKADTIFSAVAGKLGEHGMALLDSTFLLKKYLAPKGTLTRRGPTLVELADMEFGFTIAKLMGGIDVGQTVVVKDKAIVAIEAMEGTDNAIARGGAIARSGAVVVKTAKPSQDNRFDVPVVGPQTIRVMARVKAACLSIEAGKTLLIDRDATVRLADRHGICIVAA
jgi:hypothetical protein